MWATATTKDGKTFLVSNTGIVKNENGTIKAIKRKNKYDFVRYSINGFKKEIAVHKLVAMAFIPNPENKATVNHKDGIKENNHADNLEWNTLQENLAHARRHDLVAFGNRSKMAKLKEHDIEPILTLYFYGCSMTEIGKHFGVGQGAISSVINHKSWVRTALKLRESI